MCMLHMGEWEMNVIRTDLLKQAVEYSEALRAKYPNDVDAVELERIIDYIAFLAKERGITFEQ